MQMIDQLTRSPCHHIARMLMKLSETQFFIGYEFYASQHRTGLSSYMTSVTTIEY